MINFSESAAGAESAGTEKASRVEWAVYAAAALSLSAALIHLRVTPEHFEEWWGYGVFFLVVALCQGLGSVLLLRWPRQGLFLVGIWGNIAIVAAYIVTRTYGVPVGPHAGFAEEPGKLDMAATAAELGIVVALVTLLGGRVRERTVSALLAAGVAVWALRLLGVLS